MAIYQTRKRRYTSRQERVHRTNRFLRIIGVFAVIGLVAMAFFRRRSIIEWMKTYFMD